MGTYASSPGTSGFAEGAADLGTALFGNPAMAGRLAYMNARSQLEDLQARKLQGEMDARAQAQAMLAANLDPRNPADVHKFISLNYGAGEQDGGANTLLSYDANGGADDATVARAHVGAGGTIGENDAFSLPGQAFIRQGNFAQQTSLNDADNSTAITRTGMEQSGETGRNNARISSAFNIAGLDRTAQDQRAAAALAASQHLQDTKPVETAAGGTTTFYPGDQRAPTGTVHGAPTESTAIGSAAFNVTQGTDTPGDNALLDRRFPRSATDKLPSETQILAGIDQKVAAGTATPEEKAVFDRIHAAAKASNMSESDVIGGIASRIAAGTATAGDHEVWDRVHPVKPAAPPKPHNVSPADLDSVNAEIERQLGIVYEKQNGKMVKVSGGELDPAAQTAVSNRAIELYQDSGNMAAAVQQAISEATTTTQDAPVTHWFGADTPGVTHIVPKTAAPAPAAAPAAPAAAAPKVVVGSKAKLKDGTIVQWDGQQWAKVGVGG